jgi:hypothetical protein
MLSDWEQHSWRKEVTESRFETRHSGKEVIKRILVTLCLGQEVMEVSFSPISPSFF